MPSRTSSGIKKKQSNSGGVVKEEANSSASSTPKSNKSSVQQSKKQRSSESTSSSSNIDKTKMLTNAALSDSPHGTPERKWAVGEKVLCRYLNSEHLYYEAKVMFLKELSGGNIGYGIHYPGWSSRHDEVVPQHEARLRFKNYSEEDAAKAKDEVKRAQQLLSAKKRKSTDQKNRTLQQDESSRSSTPGSTDTAAKRKPGVRRPNVMESGAMSKKDIPQITLPDTLRRILIDDENLVNKQYMLPKLPARITVHDIVQKYRESVTGQGESGGGGGGGLSPREFYIEYSDRVNMLLNPTSENLERSALGLLDYFETAVGTILLYKFERPAFNDQVEQLEMRKKEEVDDQSEAEHKGAGSDLETSKPSTALTSTGAGGLQAEKRICLSKQFGLPHLLRMFVRFTDMLAYTEWSERSLEAIVRHAQDFVMFLSKNHADFYDIEKDYVLAPAEYHKRVWGNQS